MVFFKSRDKVERGGTNKTDKCERVMPKDVQAMNTVDAISFVELLTRNWCSEYDGGKKPVQCVEPLYSAEVELIHNIHKHGMGAGGTYRVWINFRNKEMTSHFVRDMRKSRREPYTKAYELANAEIPRSDTVVWQTKLELLANTGELQCKKCRRSGHDAGSAMS
jgi:hypothetical protein